MRGPDVVLAHGAGVQAPALVGGAVLVAVAFGLLEWRARRAERDAPPEDRTPQD